MRMGTLMLGVALAVSLGNGAFAKTKEVSLRDQEQAACYNDAQKLCADAIPDEDKITACMTSKKADLSPACSKFLN